MPSQDHGSVSTVVFLKRAMLVWYFPEKIPNHNQEVVLQALFLQELYHVPFKRVYEFNTVHLSATGSVGG